jgi:hypothetical protein
MFNIRAFIPGFLHLNIKRMLSYLLESAFNCCLLVDYKLKNNLMQ